jgi:hypothetical protein
MAPPPPSGLPAWLNRRRNLPCILRTIEPDIRWDICGIAWKSVQFRPSGTQSKKMAPFIRLARGLITGLRAFRPRLEVARPDHSRANRQRRVMVSYLHDGLDRARGRIDKLTKISRSSGGGGASDAEEAGAIAPTRALFAVIRGECLKPETASRSEANSNSQATFVTHQ